MADSSLAVIDRYSDNMQLVRRKYSELETRCSSSQHLATAMSGLLQGLANFLNTFLANEKTFTLPAFLSMRKTLGLCASTLEKNPSKDDIIELLSQLNRHHAALEKLVAMNTKSLTDMKRLENTSRNAQNSLQAQTAQLKQNGKNKKIEGHVVAIAGGLLAPFTFGGSLLWGVNEGDNLVHDGEMILQEYRHLKAQIPVVFQQYSHLIGTSISVVQELTGLLVILSNEVRTLSSSRTKLQLLKARARADNVSRIISKYITLSQLWSGNYDFYPYHRAAVVGCNNCGDGMKTWGVFYHAQTKDDFDLCGDCYHLKRYESTSWTKHSKAQFITHGFQICDGCYTAIKSGMAHFCGDCTFEVCNSCATTRGLQHQHPLGRAQVRSSHILDPEKVRCDECGNRGERGERIYECLDCFLYYVCSECKGKTKHPHELLLATSVGSGA